MITKRAYKNFLSNYKIFTFDTESYKYKSKGYEKQILALGSIYDGNNYYDFNVLQEFLKIIIELSEQNNKICLIAHNIKYDLQILGLINQFINDDMFLGLPLKFKFMGEVNYFHFKLKNKEIVFLDSFNFFKESLKDIAKGLKLDKFAHEEYNYKGQKWNNYIKQKGWDLVHSDVYILYEKMKSVKQSNVKYGISSASSSFREWKTNYMPVPIIDLDDFNFLGEKIYHGGRTELYHLKIPENSISLDVNSLYPYVMSKYKYSVKFHRELSVNELELMINNIRNQSYNYIINISYSSSLKRTPILQKTKSGSLCDFQTNKDIWITGQEFLSLYDSDKSLSFVLHKIYEFINCDLFSEFVNHFYFIKQHSKSDSEKSESKLMLNSLYGKMGQREKYTIYEPYSMLPDLEAFKQTNDRIKYNNVNYSLYHSFYSYKENGSYINAVVISAEITANARVVNFEYQKLLGIDNIISTDTDSFRITKEYFEKNKKMIEGLIGNELGKLKIEYDKSGLHTGYGLKDYEIILPDGNKIRKTKGIRKQSIKISDNKYEMDIFKILNKSENEVHILTTKKTLQYKITKLKYNDNGKSEIFKNEAEFKEYNKL